MSRNEEKLKQAIQSAENTKEQLRQMIEISSSSGRIPLHKLLYNLVKFGIISFSRNVKLSYYKQKLERERRKYHNA